MAIHKIAQDHVGPGWLRTDQLGPDRVMTGLYLGRRNLMFMIIKGPAA